MGLPQISPTEMAIQAIDNTIKSLKLHRAELVAQLPKRKKFTGPMVVKHPVTGEVLKRRPDK